MMMPSPLPRSTLPGTSPPAGRSPFIDSIDPRTRILTALGLSLLIAVAQDGRALGAALLAGLAAAGLARLRPRNVLRRLAPVNAFSLILIALLPLNTGGPPLLAAGPFDYSREGFLLALAITLKANAMLLWVIALLGTLDNSGLGHALHHLGLPDKLTHLLLFTVRYLDVLRGEYSRLRNALRVRGFRPRVSWHTYRTYAFLVGMLLVRSLDRSERISAAMKCRGFRGRFYLLDHFAFSRRDAWFASAAVVFAAALVWWEWT